MSSLEWDKEVWRVIDSYFKNTDNYLTKNQLDSFNQFISSNIPKTLRQFNPISVQFGDTLDISQIPERELDNYLTIFGLPNNGNNIEKRVRLQEETDKNIEKYRHEIHVYVGATPILNGEKIVSIKNNGKGIYIGKPIIQETKQTPEGKVIKKKPLYPNEARLKNLTYSAEVKVDILVEKIYNDYQETYKYTSIEEELTPAENELEMEMEADDKIELTTSNKERRQNLIRFYQKKNKQIDFYPKVSLGNIPIMLQSNNCSLDKLKNMSLIKVGECMYDQGGYFIVDGKEKVIVAQERDIDNKIYANFKKNDQDYKIIAHIRSAAENKFIPPRITKVCIMREICSQHKIVFENTIRVKVPMMSEDVPLFILFRALGFYSDRDIIKLITNENNGIHSNDLSKYTEKICEVLRPSIVESSYIINNQKDAIDYLMNILSPEFMKDAPKHYNMKHKCLMEVLKNHLLPHCGENLLDKGHFLAYMVQKALHVLLKIETETDRDSYMFKRIDISGYLLSQIFRDLYFRVKNKMLEVMRVSYSKKFGAIEKKNITKEDFYKFIDTNQYNNSVLPNQLLDRSIVNDGMLYAFKNCWGLKDAPCKAGVVQSINRISYIGFISHLRRINTPLSKSAKIRAPHALHGSSWGIMCPSETPDGGNIGIRKNLAITAIITSGTSSFLLDRLMFKLGVKDIKRKYNENKIHVEHTRVFLNERLLGTISMPLRFFKLLKLYKRNGLINIYTSISWDKQEDIIKVSTSSGRGVRPVMVVEEENIVRLTTEIIKRLKTDLTWKNLLIGIDKPPGYNDTDGRCYVTDKMLGLGPLEEGSPSEKEGSPSEKEGSPSEKEGSPSPIIKKIITELKETSGFIEYIDTLESNTSLIALNPKDLESKINRYDYCEISPTLILSILAIQIPSLSQNQAPRNQFSTSQGKQALGLYASNYRNRMDVKGQIMHYPQKPLVKSKFSKYLFTDELPHGINAIVAIGCFSGYNQEDSIIINKDAVARGLFKSTKFRTYAQRDVIENGKIVEKICNPTHFPAVRNLKSGDYTKLGNNGVITMHENLKVSENDIIVGKCVLSDEVDKDGNPIMFDNSEYVRRSEEGYVDRVYMNEGNAGQRYCKIRIRKDKIPELGDKFASRHGQKGTIGMLLPAKDLPRTAEGIVPDIIVNTHAFPSRMTIAQFLELLLGKVCAINGFESEISPFTHLDDDSSNVINKISNALGGLGYEKEGNEVLYSGITGKQLKVSFFIGPTYYQRLTHQVSDKQQSRSQGSKTALARQPVSGRAAGGGGRIGEMERDAILSHGGVSFLRESFMERSDKYHFWISCKSGLITAVNPDKGIYKDLSIDASEQKVSLLSKLQDSKNIIEKRQTETTKSDFICVEAPYAFKLLLQEIEATGIASRLISERVLRKWKVQAKKNDGLIILTDKDKDILNSDITIVQRSPLRSFHNDIKRQLLCLKNDFAKKNLENINMDNIDDQILHIIEAVAYNSNNALVDFSVGRGGDLAKWYACEYKQILGIDIDKHNIEMSSKDDESGTYYTTGDGAIQRFENMKQGIKANRRQMEWAGQANIEFIVGDSSRLFNLDTDNNPRASPEDYETNKRTFDISQPAYKDKLKEFINKDYQYSDFYGSSVKNHKFGTGAMFFAIHYLCDDYNRLNNFFINASKTIKKGGHLIITTFDGRRILNRLNNHGGKYSSDDSSWFIEKKTDVTELPSNFENGFGKQINVYVDTIGSENIEYLVHPTLLITMAKKMGFSLECDTNNKFSFPTDTFDNALPQSKFKADLEKKENQKKFSDLNRYYIFKKTEELKTLFNVEIVNEYPSVDLESIFPYRFSARKGDRVLDEDVHMNKIYTKTLHVSQQTSRNLHNHDIMKLNPNYPDLELPFMVCADHKQINKHIEYPRSLYGKNSWMNNQCGPVAVENVFEQNNCYIPKAYKTHIANLIDTDTYTNINEQSLKNTLEFVYSGIKVGIYVKIINEVLCEYVPIINLIDKAFTSSFMKELYDMNIIPSQLETLEISVDDYFDTLFTSADRVDVLSDRLFICTMNKKYYSVNLGSEMLDELIPNYYAYKEFIQKLLNYSRSGKTDAIRINDNEFMINILDMPVVKSIDNTLVHPFFGQKELADNFKLNYSEIKSNRFIPVFSSIINKDSQVKYHDFIIPDYSSFVISNNIQHKIVSKHGDYGYETSDLNSIMFLTLEETPGKGDWIFNVRNLLCRHKGSLQEQFIDGKTGRSHMEIVVVESDQKLAMVNKHHDETYTDGIVKKIEEGMPVFDDDMVWGGAEDEVEQGHDFKLKNVSYSIMPEATANLKPTEFPIFNKMTANVVIYVEGISPDYILTYCLAYRKPIIIIRHSDVSNRMWYENYFNYYSFADGVDNRQANSFYIDTKSLHEVTMAMKYSVESEEIDVNGLQESKFIELLFVEIQKCQTIVNEQVAQYKVVDEATGKSMEIIDSTSGNKYHSIGGILRNAYILSNTILGKTYYANNEEDELKNSMTLFRHFGAALNSVSHNFVGCTPDISKPMINNNAEFKTIINIEKLKHVKKDLKKVKVIEGRQFVKKGVGIQYITITGRKDNVERARYKLKASYKLITASPKLQKPIYSEISDSPPYNPNTPTPEGSNVEISDSPPFMVNTPTPEVEISDSPPFDPSKFSPTPEEKST